MAHFMYPSANPMAHVAAPAQAYSAAQGAYVAAAAPAAYATPAASARSGQTYEGYPAAYATPAASARSGQTYEGYPAALHSATQYSYSRSQVAVTPAVAYDQSKAYFQPSAATTYTVATAEPQFQAAKTVYTTGPAFTSTQRPAMVAPKLQAAPVSSTATSYVYSSSSPVTTFAASGYTAASTPQTAISGYDAAVYSAAASSLYSQPPQAKTSWFIKKSSVNNQFKVRPRGPPKAPQMHYCDVCKISCAGPQTYREHLDGQKHKKKEAAQKASQPTGRQAQHQRKCELCDVTCTGQDAYAAHIRGSKHQKVLKLHTRLGKPIPSSDPVLATNNKAATPGQKPAKTTPTAKEEPKVVAAPRINFLGGTQLKTVGGKIEEVKMTTSEANTPATTATQPFMTSADLSEDEDDGNAAAEKDVHPVGNEYIEDIKNELGKFVTFNCKLCDCKFNDPNAKEMHLKGRRHRLQYKKKVDPSLLVDIKPSIRMKKIQEEKLRRQVVKDGYWRHREQQARMLEEMRMEDDIYWGIRRLEMMPVPLHPEYPDWPPYAPLGPGLQPPYPLPPVMQRPESWDDRHVLAKHSSIYPTENELQIVQNIVSACEKALKLVSDSLAESSGTYENKTEDCLANRSLKGVMRVGVLSKGLLLRGDLHVNLVVLCSEKPTTSLLEQVGLILPKHLAAVSTVKYEVRCCVEEACLVVSKESPPAASCTITLTSPVMRQVSPSDGEGATDAPDVLNRQKCLDALAALRHSKWFQAKANGLQSSVIIIRVLRNMRQRIPLWASLSEWAMELLVEKCITTADGNVGPGDCLRRVFECLASGLLLPGGPGLCDPCEKEPSDVTSSMTSQQREEVTALAQHALRLMAFRQIHKILGMNPLPAGSYQASHFGNRKRKQPSNTGHGGVEKKDRKAKETETTH